jgi:N-acetylmuramoyl-L-alanine amidase
LASDDFQSRVAEAIYRGLSRYIRTTE